MGNNTRAWTEREDAIIIAAIKAGRFPKGIARELDRTPDAVSTRLSRLRAEGIIPPAPSANGGRKPKAKSASARNGGLKCRAQRKCLACGGTFDSDGPGNRICPRCKGLSARNSGAGMFDTSHTVRYR